MVDAPQQEIDVGAPAYEGINAAHRNFFGEFKYLNALYYLFVSAKDKLRAHLESAVANADRAARELGRPQARALGLVTHAISNTQFQGVVVPRTDAAAMAADFDGFIRSVSKHCITGSHRLLIDYVYDLLLEIDGTGRMAVSEKERNAIRNRSARPSALAKWLATAGVPLTTTPELEGRVRFLAESRNCLEHNAGVATAELCKYAHSYALHPGDEVPVGSREVGESLAIVEAVARSLNVRACKKYRL